MTQVFFYYDAFDRFTAAASLIGKAALQKKPMLVFMRDPVARDRFDRLLWTYAATSFIPHVRSDSPLAARTPVVFADAVEGAPSYERLFNLSDEIPQGFSRFTSVIEVVGQDEAERRAGRERVKFYKDRGYEIRYFNLGEKN